MLVLKSEKHNIGTFALVECEITFIKEHLFDVFDIIEVFLFLTLNSFLNAHMYIKVHIKPG